jgi:pilus assembly protein CpaB
VSQKRVLFILLISAMVGLLAVLAAFRFTSAVETDVSTPKPLYQLVIAQSDLKPNLPITKSDLSLMPWHATQVPSGASLSLDSLVGQKPIRLIKKGEVILSTHIQQASDVAPLSETIQPGFRAVTFQVNEASNVAGFIVPGSFVDVLMRAQNDGGASFSRVILQRLPVLAVGHDRVVNDPSKPKLSGLITLEVTVAQAEQIEMARGLGNLTLLLRNSNDPDKSSSPGVSAQDLQPALSIIDIIRGTERSREILK